jgi:hypothetical protein
MNNFIKNILLMLLVCTFNLFGITLDTISTLPIGIKLQESEELKLALQFADSRGTHIIALLRSHIKYSDENEKIVLKAIQFKFESRQWIPEWKIWDFVECQHLDIQGEFLTNLTSITDLDSNKIFETTVAYQMICTGDVSPKTTKVIMRQGEVKYAVRGESLITIGKDVKYGGTFEPDKALNEVPKFKTFIIEKWKTAAGIKEPPPKKEEKKNQNGQHILQQR